MIIININSNIQKKKKQTHIEESERESRRKKEMKESREFIIRIYMKKKFESSLVCALFEMK